jgi:predicted GH43/DUF377 family glycosyl hydrolase
MRKLSVRFIWAAAVAVASSFVFAADKNPDTEWMANGKVGAFTHYLVGANGFAELDKYDVKAVANQLASAGVAWFGLTLGQNSGWYISPNATYEKIAGYGVNERCSKRDIPLELGRELKARNIRFMLYLPCQTPNGDAKAVGAFGLDAAAHGDRKFVPGFSEKWAKVIEEWSVRYGNLVSGWWFDGGYQGVGFSEADAALYAAAVKKGNPHAIVAFNPGVCFKRAKAADDYTAGELNEPFKVSFGRWADGAQGHTLTFLGKTWGNPSPRFSDGEWIGWAGAIAAQGGAITLDVSPEMPRGTIVPVELAQLSHIAHAVRFGGATREPALQHIAGKAVEPEKMKAIYEEVKTPYKYGIVLKADRPGDLVDCPNVFRHGNDWCMLYVSFNGQGYETWLAKSSDLVHWTKAGKALAFGGPAAWDEWQSDGGPALLDTAWGGSCNLQKYENKYWMTFIGGCLQGYETDPLSIGVATTDDPASGLWTKDPANPVLSASQPDAREFESYTLYKTFVVWDKAASLGWPFVMYYNGKGPGGERIGMAVSKDMRNWRRYGTVPVVENAKAGGGWGISGDPMITKIGDVWVMFYFGAFWRPDAFDTFACSYDLANWTKWDGEALVKPSEPWDKQYAHKPWVVKWNGVVYHFYCAVGDQGRAIALATSKPLVDAQANAAVGK